MVFKLQKNTSSRRHRVVWTETEPLLMVVPKPNKKHGGTVFPAKRRLVKTMVMASILRFFASILCSSEAGGGEVLSQPEIPIYRQEGHAAQVVPLPHNYQ